MSFIIDASSEISDGPQEQPDVLFPLPTVRTYHETQTSCQICSCIFQKAGPAHTQKRFCHFCYSAICSRCLSFEYFHSETGHSEPMCSKCHHLLAALSLDYSQDVSKYRLERLELRKQIKLAAEQKEFYMKERQIVSAKLEILRKSLELSVSDLNAQLEGLRLENKSLEKKKALGSDALKDLEFRKNLVKENYLKTAQLFNGLKKEKEREFKENEKRREEYNQITMKIAFLKNQISKEDDLGEENFSGEDVRAEIVEIKKSLDRIDKKVHRKERKNKEVNKRITENNIVIEELMGKFNEIKENPSNGLALEEVQRLDELKRQLNDLDALILILEKRKNLTIDIQERRSEANQERRSEVIRSKDQESFQFKERKTFHFMVLPCEESLPLDIQNEKSIKSQKNDNLLRVKKKKKHENGSETESKTETKSRECDRYCSNCDII